MMSEANVENKHDGTRTADSKLHVGRGNGQPDKGGCII